jgi:hypothetical protein
MTSRSKIIQLPLKRRQCNKSKLIQNHYFKLNKSYDILINYQKESIKVLI